MSWEQTLFVNGFILELKIKDQQKAWFSFQ